jgi:hypothetical protein
LLDPVGGSSRLVETRGGFFVWQYACSSFDSTMAFVLKQSDGFIWPVSIELPVDGGLYEAQTFDVKFKRMSQKWIRDIAKKIESEEAADVDVAREVVIGWSGITDGAGKELPFSQKALEQLLDVPTMAGELVMLFFKATAGAKTKN